MYRHKDEKSIVLGHYFKLEEGWKNMQEVFEKVREACNPSYSVDKEKANGFFFYLGVGNYIDFLNELLHKEEIKYFVGYRKGNVYLYGRKDLKLYIKLIGKKKSNGRKSVQANR